MVPLIPIQFWINIYEVRPKSYSTAWIERQLVIVVSCGWQVFVTSTLCEDTVFVKTCLFGHFVMSPTCQHQVLCGVQKSFSNNANCCEDLLERSNSDDTFLKSIITSDLETESQSSQWIGRSSQRPREYFSQNRLSRSCWLSSCLQGS